MHGLATALDRPRTLYSLYDQDEERTHHPTTDDFVGVFHLVTIGTWVMFIGSVRSGSPIRP